MRRLFSLFLLLSLAVGLLLPGVFNDVAAETTTTATAIEAAVADDETSTSISGQSNLKEAEASLTTDDNENKALTETTPPEAIPFVTLQDASAIREVNTGPLVIELSPQIVMDLALKQNLRLAIREAAERQTAAEKLKALAQFFPSIQAQYFLERFDGGTVVIRENPIDLTRVTHIPQVSFNLDIPLGGKPIYGYLQASKLQDAARFETSDMRQQVCLDALSAYFQLLRFQETVKQAQLAVDEAERLIAFHELRQEKGVGRQLEVWQSEAEAAQRRESGLLARQELEAARVELLTLLNLPLLDVELLTAEQQLEPLPLLPEKATARDLLAEASDTHPRLKQLRTEVEAKRKQLGTIRSDFLPTVNLSGYTGGIGPSPSELTAVNQIGGAVTLDLLDHLGLETLGRLRQAKAELEQLELQAQLETQTLSQQILVGYNNWQVAKDLVEARREAARKAYEVSRKRLSMGMGTNLEVISAFTYQSEAELKYQQSLADYNITQLELLYACGKLESGLLRQQADLAVKPGESPPPDTPADKAATETQSG